MSARRALVVDDSRSARAFLTRILERYELAVDGVESAIGFDNGEVGHLKNFLLIMAIYAII